MDLPKKKIVDNYINYYLFATMFKIQFYVYCMLLINAITCAQVHYGRWWWR